MNHPWRHRPVIKPARNGSYTLNETGNSTGCAMPTSVPTDFFQVGFNDKGWNDIQVPGTLGTERLRRPGLPQHRTHAWRGWFKNDPPRTFPSSKTRGFLPPHDRHPGCMGGQADRLLHFGSVTSNIYLGSTAVMWKLAARTANWRPVRPHAYVKFQQNLIAFQVFPTGATTPYLEDQDFFRLSGGRDCYLYARIKRRITDIQVSAIAVGGLRFREP